MSDCIFCKIVAGEIPAAEVYRDERAVAFEDLNPQAPTHVLVVPAKHIDSLAEADHGDADLLGHLLMVGQRIARERGIIDSGYRTVINTNEEAGQTVFHIHVHVLGGRPMAWPPG